MSGRFAFVAIEQNRHSEQNAPRQGITPRHTVAGWLTDGERSAMVKEIQLTQDKVALVDDADFEWLNQRKWYYAPRDKSSGGYANRTRRKADGPGTRHIHMHRSLLGPIPEGLAPDHIDGDGLNNQRGNLRLATRSQNNMNGRLHRNNTSGYRGVRWEKRRRQWRAALGVNGRLINLGRFDDPVAAAHAYNQAALEHYGEFAFQNPV